MESVFGQILVAILMVGIAYGLGRISKKTKIKIEKPDDLQMCLNVLENIEFLNSLNPLVVEIYKQFIDEEGLKYFHLEHYNLHIKNLGIQIWSANDWDNRKFNVVPDDLLKKYNMTLKELNNTLTAADKKILDKIVQEIKINNEEFISRLFI